MNTSKTRILVQIIIVAQTWHDASALGFVGVLKITLCFYYAMHHWAHHKIQLKYKIVFSHNIDKDKTFPKVYICKTISFFFQIRCAIIAQLFITTKN